MVFRMWLRVIVGLAVTLYGAIGTWRLVAKGGVDSLDIIAVGSVTLVAACMTGYAAWRLGCAIRGQAGARQPDGQRVGR